ncbi:MAG: Hpt domain-containing protein [Cyanobacteria bacterium J055]|nr:MAG: Hpt domain-containing protein [Cyanobacteria bacterium J055]
MAANDSFHLFPYQTDPETTVVNLQVLEQLREELQLEGEPDVVTELIDLFLADTPALIESIQLDLDRREAEELRQHAHALKGMCRNLGIVGMAGLLAALERHAALGSLQDAPEMVAQLDAMFDRVRQILESQRRV